MNFLKFFRRQGFKKINKKYFIKEHITWEEREVDVFVYYGETNTKHATYYKIKEVKKKDLKEGDRPVLFDFKHGYNMLSFDLNENEKLYLAIRNREYSLLFLSNNGKLWAEMHNATLKNDGIEKEYYQNMKNLIGEVRYRDFKLEQLLKKDEKI